MQTPTTVSNVEFWLVDCNVSWAPGFLSGRKFFRFLVGFTCAIYTQTRVAPMDRFFRRFWWTFYLLHLFIMVFIICPLLTTLAFSPHHWISIPRKSFSAIFLNRSTKLAERPFLLKTLWSQQKGVGGSVPTDKFLLFFVVFVHFNSFLFMSLRHCS